MSSSFTLFKFRESTSTVVDKGRNRVYENISVCDHKLSVLADRETKLIKEGTAAKKANNRRRFIMITEQLRQIDTERKQLNLRKATLNRQLSPLEDSKRQLDDIEAAKTITTANRRIVADIGGVKGVLDLQRNMEKSTFDLTEGVGNAVNELFAPEDGISDEDLDPLDDAAIDDIWKDRIDEEDSTGGGGGAKITEDELGLRFDLLSVGLPDVPVKEEPSPVASSSEERVAILVPAAGVVSEKKTTLGGGRWRVPGER